jgi:putative flippase GtrA
MGYTLTGLLVNVLHGLITLLFVHYVLALPLPANGVAFALATVASYLINAHGSFPAGCMAAHWCAS